jgi:hypothetical protein
MPGRALGSYFRAVLVLARKGRPIFSALVRTQTDVPDFYKRYDDQIWTVHLIIPPTRLHPHPNRAQGAHGGAIAGVRPSDAPSHKTQILKALNLTGLMESMSEMTNRWFVQRVALPMAQGRSAAALDRREELPSTRDPSLRLDEMLVARWLIRFMINSTRLRLAHLNFFTS